MKVSVLIHPPRTSGSSDLLRLTLLSWTLGSSLLSAQSTTYTYSGNPFSVAACETKYNPSSLPPGPSVPTCVTGSITGSVIIQNLPANFTGIVNSFCGSVGSSLPCFASLTLNGQGNALTITTASTDNDAWVYFQSGSIVNWDVGVASFINNQVIQYLSFCGPEGEVNCYIANNGISFDNSTICNVPGDLNCTDGFETGSPGTWTTTPTQCSTVLLSPFRAGPYANGQPTTMNAQFVPGQTMGLPKDIDAAAAFCGFTGFNWQQTVQVRPNPNPLSVCGLVEELCQFARSKPTQPLQAPYPDPPEGGGYTSESFFDDAYPFYYTKTELAAAKTSSSLNFIDQPITPLLDPAVQAAYHFSPTAPTKLFVTSLVGVLPNGEASPPLFSWTWADSFDGGSAGGIIIIQDEKNLTPIPAANGTGGVTITSINGRNLPTDVSNQVSVIASGLAYSRVTQTFNGTITVTNISSSGISGPLQFLLTGITTGVSLVNATGNLSGTPFMTVNSASLPPGQSVTIRVQFDNPLSATINFIPAVYSGSLN